MRVPNWDVKLHEWALSVAGQPFAWGKTDCGSLVRQAFALMYGRELVELPIWGTEHGAMRALAETGGVERVLRELDAVEVPRSFAQQGDVFCEADGGHGVASAAVLVGGDWICSDHERGVYRLPLRSAGAGKVMRHG